MSEGRFDNVDIPEFTLGNVIAADEWRNDKLSTKNTYAVGTSRTKMALQRIIHNVLNSMRTDSPSLKTCKEIIICCHHLTHNIKEGFSYLLESDYPMGLLDMEYKEESSSPSPKKTRKERVKRSREKTPDEADMTAQQLAERGLEETPLTVGFVSYWAEEEVSVSENEDEPLVVRNYSDDQLKFMIFAVSFLSKIIGKGEENIERSWPVMKENYKRFYISSSGVIDLPSPSKKWLTALKGLFHTDISLGRTLIRLMVHWETKLEPGTSTAGMIRYLFCMQLAFTGMHAYKLYQNVKSASGLPNKYLLNCLVHPATVAAIEEIVNIITNFERRPDHRDRSPAFKYARLVGPQYFQNLQTKSCPALVYCLVMLVKKYEENDTYDPENIYGIKGLGDEIKKTMARAANLIYESKPPKSIQVYSEIMLQATTGSGGRSEEKKETPVDPFA